MPFTYGHRRRASVSAQELSIDQAIELRFGNNAHYRNLRVIAGDVSGRAALSRVAVRADQQTEKHASLFEFNAAAVFGEDESRLVVGRYFVDGHGDPRGRGTQRRYPQLHRAYRIGQAMRDPETGEWQHVDDIYNDSLLHDQASLADIRDGVVAGASRQADDALRIGSEARTHFLEAISRGSSTAHGIDFIEPLLQHLVDQVVSRETLAS